MTASGGIAPTYAVASLGPDLAPTSSAPLAGLPSRARMSVDGRLVSTTTFISGHSYAASSFSTATVIRVGGKDLPNLETWTTYLPDGQRLVAANRNFWGVTFATDDDTFYATAASGTTTWLVRGSIKERTMRALRTDAECPSLSPDGRHVAYKKRLGNPTPGVWRLAVARPRPPAPRRCWPRPATSTTRSSGSTTPRCSTRCPAPGPRPRRPTSGGCPSDGSGAPSVLVPYASSPAVVAAGRLGRPAMTPTRPPCPAPPHSQGAVTDDDSLAHPSLT